MIDTKKALTPKPTKTPRKKPGSGSAIPSTRVMLMASTPRHASVMVIRGFHREEPEVQVATKTMIIAVIPKQLATKETVAFIILPFNAVGKLRGH
jgi:hypothetical protein